MTGATLVVTGLPAAGKSHRRSALASASGGKELDCAAIMGELLQQPSHWQRLRSQLATFAGAHADQIWPEPGWRSLQMVWTPLLYSRFEAILAPLIARVVLDALDEQKTKLIVEATPIFALQLRSILSPASFLVLAPSETTRRRRLARRMALPNNAPAVHKLASFHRQIYGPALASLPRSEERGAVCLR